MKSLATYKAFLRRIPIAWQIALVIIIIIIALLIAHPSKDTERTEETSWKVHTQKAQLGDYQPRVPLLGVVVSPQHSHLKAGISADVVATPVLVGDDVKPDQLLVELDDREARLNLTQRQAELQELQAQLATEQVRQDFEKELLAQQQRLVALNQNDLNRQKSLRNKRVSSQANVDDSEQKWVLQQIALAQRQQSVRDQDNRLAALQAKILKARALLARAELDLSRTQIKAPFAGVITELQVSVGDRVQIGAGLIRLYQNDSIEVRAQIPNQYSQRIRTALNTQADIFAVIETSNAQLRLDRLAGSINPGRGGVDAYFNLLNKQPALALGKTVALTLALPLEKQVYKIPEQALYRNNTIYLMHNNRMKRVYIELVGRIKQNDESYVLVRSDDIKENDDIIITQLPNAREGLKVKQSP